MSLKKLEDSRAFLVALFAAAFVLLVVAALGLGGKLPVRSPLKGRPNSTDVPKLVQRMETLFAPATLTSLRPATNGPSPFYTTHFQPATPPTAKPAPAPAAKKIQLTFQGLYQSSAGEKRAFVKVGNDVIVGTVGTKVFGDWNIADIALRDLTLKNAAAQTNVLQFNVSKEFDLPNP